jgi:transposase
MLHYDVGMYLRTTSGRKRKDGSRVSYYQLAHNERPKGGGAPVAHVIHTFGRADELDRDELVRLTRSIARVCGLTVVDPLAEGSDVSSVATDAGLPADVKLVRTSELGTVAAIEGLWERLGIGAALRKVAGESRCKVPYERALLAMTANRLCEPESKLGVWDRWLERVHLPSCDDLKLAQMYEAMDLLHEHCARVEEAVFFETANLFNLEVDVVFYDTTSASFAIDEADEDDEETGEHGLRKLGHSKEGTWTPQVVVALAVTREGLPVRSWVFPGNTADITTVERVKADLRGWKLGRALFVADSGMNSEDSRHELAKACGKYLLASRMGSVKEVRDEVLSRAGRYKVISENLHAKEVNVGDGELRRRYVLCFNPHEAERQRKHREQVVEELEAELARHPERKATAQWAIELKASGRYGRYLRISKGGSLEMDREAIYEAQRNDGKWVVQTNDDTLTVDDAASGYKAMLVIERCFRSLKRTQIRMTPMFHWVPRRIETHVKVCVLALLIERVAERQCGRPWLRIRETLRSLQATEFQTTTHRFFQRNHPTQAVVAAFKSLGLELPKRVLAIVPGAGGADRL